MFTGPNYTRWYDFNGNGVDWTRPYILQGHECLVFFLGGIPLSDHPPSGYGMTGFGKDPTNPFTNNTQRPYQHPNPCTAITARRRSSSSTLAGWFWTPRTRIPR